MDATLVHQNFSTASPPAPPRPTSSGPTSSAAWVALLRREAAHLGPGFFGVRRDGTDAERLALARRFADLGEPAPVYVLTRADWTDRRARLLAAAPSADPSAEKGPKVTEVHLDALVRGFDAPVPVLIEHAESPQGLGYVTALVRRGDALLGTITLSAEADALLRACGASALAVGLTPDLSRLVEVSLVRGHGTPDARLFGGGPSFAAELETDPAPSSATRPAPSQTEIEEAAAMLLLPEEAAFYRRHSPGLPLGQIVGGQILGRL